MAIYGIASVNSTASQIASRREYDRSFRYDAQLERQVKAVTVEEVNTALRTYLVRERFTVVRAGDFAKSKSKVPVQ